MQSPPIRFSCPTCRQILTSPADFAGRQISCPACKSQVSVPAPPVKAKGQRTGLVITAVVSVALLIGAGLYWRATKGRPASGEASLVQAEAPTPAPTTRSAGAPPTAVSSESKLIRSGASDWEAVEAFYRASANAQELPLASQPVKGSVYQLTGFNIDQVGSDFMLISNRATKDRWVISPDNPRAMDEITISDTSVILYAIGVYAGPKDVPMVSGASARLPVLTTFALSTTRGFINLENPAAEKASSGALETARLEHEAALKKESDEREAANERRRVAAEEKERQQRSAYEAARVKPPWQDDEVSDKNRLPNARARLAAVESRIDSERKRYSEALNLINTLTKNKTVPVREGSVNYQRCMAASKIINEVEEGAANLKADKASLDALVSELEKQSAH